MMIFSFHILIIKLARPLPQFTPFINLTYFFLANLSTPAEKRGIDAIREAISDYHQFTCLKFVPRTTQKNYVRFTQGQGYVVTATADCNVHLTNKISDCRSLDFSFSLKRETGGFLNMIQIRLSAIEN